MTDRRWQLMWATQALALPAAVQLSLFPDFVCKVDELALDFGAWCDSVLSHEAALLSPIQASLLVEMNNKLTAMSGPQPYWTEDALRQSPVWAEVRQLSAAILLAFNWVEGIPPSDRASYVPAGRASQ